MSGQAAATLEAMRTTIYELWKTEPSADVRRLLWTAWAALTTICNRLNRKEKR